MAPLKILILISSLGGGFKHVSFSPQKLGKISILTIIFFNWVVQPPTSHPILYLVTIQPLLKLVAPSMVSGGHHQKILSQESSPDLLPEFYMLPSGNRTMILWKRWFHTKMFIRKDVLLQMAVSENNGTPKSPILIGFSIINHPFWGTSIFGNTQIEACRKNGCMPDMVKKTQFLLPGRPVL